jgi:5-formyltetrahydrofolate cyclo-ligase
MIGLAFECQILQDITIEPHDEKLDAVLTSTKVYRR